ncbi:MAG: hypothetical protein Q8K75_12900 [Chlamydiales bacterium]|nr:hypothetical protein [Chlamydiales bacterium]
MNNIPPLTPQHGSGRVKEMAKSIEKKIDQHPMPAPLPTPPPLSRSSLAHPVQQFCPQNSIVSVPLSPSKENNNGKIDIQPTPPTKRKSSLGLSQKSDNLSLPPVGNKNEIMFAPKTNNDNNIDVQPSTTPPKRKNSLGLSLNFSPFLKSDHVNSSPPPLGSHDEIMSPREMSPAAENKNSLDHFKVQARQTIRSKLSELDYRIIESENFAAIVHMRLQQAYTAAKELKPPKDAEEWVIDLRESLKELTDCQTIFDLRNTYKAMSASSAKNIAQAALGGSAGIAQLKKINHDIRKAAQPHLNELLKTPVEKRSYPWPVTADEKKAADGFPSNNIEFGGIRAMVHGGAAQFTQINILGLDGSNYSLDNNYGTGLDKDQEKGVLNDFLDLLYAAGYHSDRPIPDLHKVAETLSKYQEADGAHVLRAIEIGALAPGSAIFKQTSGTDEEQHKYTWPKGDIVRTIQLLSPTRFRTLSTKVCEIQRKDDNTPVSSSYLTWELIWEEEGSIIKGNLKYNVTPSPSGKKHAAWQAASDERLRLTAQARFDPLVKYLSSPTPILEDKK